MARKQSGEHMAGPEDIGKQKKDDGTEARCYVHREVRKPSRILLYFGDGEKEEIEKDELDR